MELDHPERQQGLEPRRRFPSRIILPALIAIVAATLLAAGLALTKNGSTPIGTGVVVIETNLAYQGGQAAGTGMVLDVVGRDPDQQPRDPRRHRHQGRVPAPGGAMRPRSSATTSRTTLPSCRRAAPSDLKTAPLGSSSSVDVGQSVQAVGNAGGTGSLSQPPAPSPASAARSPSAMTRAAART